MKSHTPENALVILPPDKVAIIKAVEIGNPDRIYGRAGTARSTSVASNGEKLL